MHIDFWGLVNFDNAFGSRLHNKLLLNLILKLKNREQSKRIKKKKQIEWNKQYYFKKTFGANHGKDPSYMHLILGTYRILFSTSFHSTRFSWHDLFPPFRWENARNLLYSKKLSYFWNVWHIFTSEENGLKIPTLSY